METFENITYDTFKETAIAMNLVNDDVHVMNIFNEAVDIMMPNQTRHFFSLFIMSENYQAFFIWQKFKNFFMDDFKIDPENQAINSINKLLKFENFSCSDFGLPEPDLSYESRITDVEEIDFENCKEL